MLLPIILLAGCGVWVVNEAIEIFSSGLADIVGTTGGLANGLLCIGLWVFWPSRPREFLGRAGVILASAGMAILTWRSVSLALAGERSDTAIVTSPIFIWGAAGIGLGVVLIGVWIVRSKAFPAWIGLTMIGGTLLSIALGVLKVSPLIQSGANIVLAIVLAESAVLAMGNRPSRDRDRA